MTSWLPGELLADQAHAATHPGPCALCPHAILHGQRAARLIDGRGLAHLGCLAVMPAPVRVRRA